MFFWLWSYRVFRSQNWTRTSGTRSSQGQSYARISTTSHQETASVLPRSDRLLPDVDTIVRTQHSKIVRHEEEKHNFPMVARSWTRFCSLQIVSCNEIGFTTPYYSRAFGISVDSSDVAIGACLFQEWDGVEHPRVSFRRNSTAINGCTRQSIYDCIFYVIFSIAIFTVVCMLF